MSRKNRNYSIEIKSKKSTDIEELKLDLHLIY